MWWNDLQAKLDIPSEVRGDISPAAIVSPDARIEGAVQIGEGTRVCAGAMILGPVRIGRDCMIGNNAFIRGSTVIGDHCSVGFCTEIKSARLGNGVSIGPQCFIADSRVDDGAYLGALVRTSNHRLDGGTVKVMHQGQLHDTALEKLGAWIGARAALGVGVIILPGRIVEADSEFGPRITIEKNLPRGRYRLAQQLHCFQSLE